MTDRDFSGAKGVGMAGQGITRRGLMKKSLKAGAYAAPVILASLPVPAVSAATPAPILCGTTVTFTQDVALFNAAPGAAYDVYAAPNGIGPTRVLTLTADATFGAAFGVFSLTVPSGGVTFVTISVVLAGNPPAPALASFNSTLVGTVACTAGGPRAAAAVIGRAFQETTNCGGAASTYTVTLDVAVQNAAPSTSYDVYYQANNAVPAGFARAGTLTTNAAGNVTQLFTVSVNTSTPTPPSAIVINVVPAGMAATPPTFTTTLSGNGIVNVVCFPGVTPTGQGSGVRLLAIR
jgi:hypothetical protein